MVLSQILDRCYFFKMLAQRSLAHFNFIETNKPNKNTYAEGCSTTIKESPSIQCIDLFIYSNWKIEYYVNVFYKNHTAR